MSADKTPEEYEKTVKMLQDTWFAKPFTSSTYTDISALFSVHTIPTLVLVSYAVDCIFLNGDVAAVQVCATMMDKRWHRGIGFALGSTVHQLCRKLVSDFPLFSQIDVVNAEIVTYNAHHELERDPEGLFFPGPPESHILHLHITPAPALH